MELGTEHLILLFTQSRLILAHVSRVGRVGAVLSTILGRMSQGLGFAPDRRKLLEKMSGLSPNSIMEMDRDNFAVGFDQVVSMTIEREGFDRASIVLVTTDMKTVMSSSLIAVQGLRETIASLLPGKIFLKL